MPLVPGRRTQTLRLTSHGLTPTAVRKADAGNLLFTMRGPEDGNLLMIRSEESA